MSGINVTIDNKKVCSHEGATILDAAQSIGIDIPTLCHYKDLLPHGGCRLCLVELKQGSRSHLVASCGYYVTQGLEIETDSPRVRKARSLVLEILLAYLGESPRIRAYALRYRVTTTRFNRSLEYCVLCGLCVRYCDEVKKAHALGFVGRGVDRDVAWVPLNSYDDLCKNCMECQHLCPTGVFPSNWGMAKPAVEN